MVLLQRELYFSKDPEGSNIFQWGVQLLPVHPPPPPPPPMDSHINTEAVILIETGFLMCVQTDKTYKTCAFIGRQTEINIHAHVQTDKRIET